MFGCMNTCTDRNVQIGICVYAFISIKRILWIYKVVMYLNRKSKNYCQNSRNIAAMGIACNDHHLHTNIHTHIYTHRRVE